MVCRLGFCPRTHWGAYNAPTDPQLYLEGLILKTGEWGRWRREGRERTVREERGKEFVLCPRKKKKSAPMITTPKTALA